MPQMVPGVLWGMGAEKATGVDAGVSDTVKSVTDTIGLQENETGIDVGTLPEAPSVDDATEKAKQAVKKRRRITLLSGGETDVTKGTGLLGASNLVTKTLLGQ